MSNEKKQARTKRSPQGDTAKKIVSLTIDPALVSQVDAIASDKGISRSAAFELILADGLAVLSGRPVAPPVTSPSARPAEKVATAVKVNDCIFASPQLGTAIRY